MAEITIPIVLDASASATIFSESSVTSDVSYVFTMDSSSLTGDKLKNFLRYTDDDDSGNTLFAYSETAKEIARNALRTDIINQQVTHLVDSVDQQFPNHAPSAGTSTIGEMLVKYIASALFGHPEAQAPIENDTSIINQVQVDSKLAQQFVDELAEGLEDTDVSGDDTVGSSSYVIQSIFEQLVAYSSETVDGSDNLTSDNNRFGNIDHTDVYNGIPFKDGDTIIFLIQMGGKLQTDNTDYTGNLDDPFTSDGPTDLSSLFSSNPEVKNDGVTLVDKIWEIRMTLGGSA